MRGWDLLEQPNHITLEKSVVFSGRSPSLSCHDLFAMDTLTSHTRPTTDATITVRCIKSFEYRTCKSLVLQHLNLETTTVGELKSLVRESKTSLILKRIYTTRPYSHIRIEIKTTSGWKPYQNVEFGKSKDE